MWHDTMGLFKKLTVRNKPKSTWDLAESTTARPTAHELDVPKQAIRTSTTIYAPPPPPYELEAELGDTDTDTGSILIGIDFGTT